MIRNYFLASIRALLKHKSSVLINIGGLVLGLVVCALISLYLHHELGYDQYHEKSDRIFRVVHDETAGEIPGTRRLATVGPPVGPAFKEKFSQVEDAVRFRYTPDHVISYLDKRHYESRIFYVDPSVFSVFTFPLAAGNSRTALSTPNSVVITQEMASKYFGREEALGKVLTMDGHTALEVTGVLHPIPANTHLKFDFLLPFESFRVPPGYPVTLQDWGWISFHTYILMKPGQEASVLEASLPSALVKEHWSEERAKKFKLRLQPLASIYLGEFPHESVASGNKVYLFVLTCAALLILLVAGFNFANLFAVISAARARELGVRKVVGSRSSSLATQIVGQSVGIAVVSALLAGATLPVLAQGVTKYGLPLTHDGGTYAVLAMVMTLVACIIGLSSGIYPALTLSRFPYQKLLKGTYKQTGSGVSVRNGMMLVQFVISVALISSVLVIHDQINYLRHKDLGYARNELLLLRMPGDQLRLKFPQLKNLMMQNPDISGVSVGGGRMDGDNGNVPITGEGQMENESQPMAIDAVTFDFFKTIGIIPLSGREFTETFPADTVQGVIINLVAAKTLGWDAQTAIGKRIRVGNIVLDGRVIGVIPDFHFGSLHSEIAPLVMYYPRTRLQDIYVRFGGHDLRTIIGDIEADWHSVVPELPFAYTLMNDHLNGLYRAEQFFDILFRFFASIAILIACLGLYGVVSQDVSYRLKEIGIRKVMGAETGRILSLILFPILRLLIIANLLAWPLTWMMMQEWLDEFTYHVPFNWSVFPLAMGLVIVAAALATCYRTYSAAQANPAETLRNE